MTTTYTSQAERVVVRSGEIVMTADVSEQIMALYEEAQAANDLVCKTLRGWVRNSASTGIRNEFHAKAAACVDSGYDEDDIQEFGEACFMAAKAFAENYDAENRD